VACKDDSRAVYLTGSDMTAVSQELLTQIAATCKEKGVSVVLGSEISYHADALEAMAEVGHVVFVEQLRGAYYDEIYKEISTCMEHKIQVLGMVVTGA
jgi:pyruvate-formate lyase-activating enzyme